MTWRYDVYVCPDSDALSHGLYCHDRMEKAEGTFLDYGYRDAFRLAHDQAEESGHAAVWTTSPHTGNTVLSYQHIRGGGPCETCPPKVRGRGPWTTHVLGDQFMCANCATQARRRVAADRLWSEDECPWYWPVLDRALKD
ncbi:hypothetical protein GCM10010211_48660 [Streptomyces albospinus]|uniref:Uncharacterized protein n=2 Tax=Streptomyces TaxID=1883 RepID=A0A124HGZ9_9ACTN|nr:MULTISPECIES: hypothetical protein [Streptomyces]KUN08607.1 hypothetical protein AQI95_09655 [Streptomyces yokosukanensis]GGU77023.1 hypothetical protein GCM10010211_48660 [Streptomyces albospinus]